MRRDMTLEERVESVAKEVEAAVPDIRRMRWWEARDKSGWEWLTPGWRIYSEAGEIQAPSESPPHTLLA